jgi:bidirectional [NiFe] hydrogenase diaphorase subunit
MQAVRKRPEAPSADPRWKMVRRTMQHHGYSPNALIETLHAVQDAFGFLEPEAMDFVAASLNVAPSRVYGVATFYHFFHLRPKGAHTCVVCMGTACYIKGAGAILKAVEEEFGVKAGETSADGSLSVLTARCFGSCGLAPVVVLDGEVTGKLTPETAMDKIRSLVTYDA